MPGCLACSSPNGVAMIPSASPCTCTERDTIGALCGPGQTRRVVRYLAERGHVEGRGDLIRIRAAQPGELPLLG